MKFRLFVIALISLTYIFVFGKSNDALANINLAPNSSFEEGSERPEEWGGTNGGFCGDSSTPAHPSFSWSSDFANSGSHSVGLENINWTQQNNNIPGHWSSINFIPILKSQEYEASVLYKVGDPHRNIGPVILVCGYDNNGKLVGGGFGGTQFPVAGGWYSITARFQSATASKIKVHFGTNCFLGWPYGLPCTGSIYFDDVTVKPVGKFKIHNFEDLNRNSSYDQGETNLSDWRFQIFSGHNCEGDWFMESPTKANGETIIPNVVARLSLGDYSALSTMIYLARDENGRVVRHDARQEGWTNTTPICQNVTLRELETPVLSFGNIRGPTVPYFSQKNPQWGQDEYDHGNTFGPFFCGTTMAGCGCAVTSSAMILKYHGVDKSPNGDPTNPQTLNNWLKANNGYSFGALKWPSIATYALKANQNFGTQKIKFSGVGSANNYTQLNNDLNNQRPPILQEPGHFIAATGIQGSTYTINDPAFQNKTTLAAYNNQFTSMRRFEKTNTDLSALYLTTPAPNDLFLVDSQGRRVGRDPQTGEIYTEIPNSYYFLEPAFPDQSQENPTQPPESEGVNTLLILTPSLNTFTLNSQGGAVDFSAYDTFGDIQTESFNFNHQSFEINYSPEPGATFEVFQNIAIDIRPGDDKNHINLHSKLIPVSFVGSSDFDPQTVDLDSILFGPNKIPLFRENSQLLLFETRDSGISYSDTQACLVGMTIYGEKFKGCDFITIVPS